MSSDGRSSTAAKLKFMVAPTRVAAFILLAAMAHAEQHPSEHTPDIARLFANDSLLEVTIEAPLTTLMRERPEEEYLSGTFSFTGDNGAQRKFDLKLRTRGKFRRLKERCDFAPIRLNFRKDQVRDTVFAGQDKLKLVTHCQNSTAKYEQLVLREYLAYRILGLLTSKSYGVRLLQINYINSESTRTITKPGFVIEDDENVARRNNMKTIKTSGISNLDLDRKQMNVVHVFQYMIGNTDYSLFKAEPGNDCCHNSDLMSATDEAPFTPLPFDFDFAGIVNAPYAKPNIQFNIHSVRTRYYKGLCKNNDLLPGTLQLFLDKRDAVYAVVDEVELLSSRNKRNVSRYLDSFYNRISNPNSIATNLTKRCLDLP